LPVKDKIEGITPDFLQHAMTSHILISRYQPLVDESRDAIREHIQYLLEPGHPKGSDEELADLIVLWRASERAIQAALDTSVYEDAEPIAMPPDTPEYSACRRMAAVILLGRIYDEPTASPELLLAIKNIMANPRCAFHPPSCACHQLDGWVYHDDAIQALKDYYANVADHEEGTKFMWVFDSETYRIAVKTKTGVLEVKSVTNGGGLVHSGCDCVPCAEYNMVPRAPWRQTLPLLKTHFDDYRAWLDSLPVGGSITITRPDTRTALQRRAQVPADLTDIEKLVELERRFKIRSTVYVTPSLQQTKDLLFSTRENITSDYVNMALTAPPEILNEVRWRMTNIRQAYDKHVKLMEGKTAEECSQIRYIYLQRGTGKLMAYCDGKMYGIASCNGQICRDDGRIFSSFKEMGAKTVIARYRGQLIAV